MVDVSIDVSVESEFEAVARAAFLLMVLVHGLLFFSALILNFVPSVIGLLLYPVVVDRIGLSKRSTQCTTCGASNKQGTVVCKQCRGWLGNVEGYRWLLLGGVAAPLLAFLVEVVLVAFYLGPPGQFVEPLYQVIYPGGSALFAFSAGLMYFGAGLAYVFIRGLTSTLLHERFTPFATRE